MSMLLLILLLLFIVEVVCLIYLYHRVFYRKASHFDITFIITFFVAFVSALQFLSLLYIYGKVEGQLELSALFIIFSSVVPCLYIIPIAIVGSREEKGVRPLN